MPHCGSNRLKAEGSKLKAHPPLGFLLMWGGSPEALSSLPRAALSHKSAQG